MAENPATSSQAAAVGPLARVAKRPGPLTTFHPFPWLPVELQNKIWALAVDVEAPRGYNVGFTRTKRDVNSPTMTWGLRKLRQVDEPYLGECNITRNVMAAGRWAANVAKLEWRNWQPDVPFRLEDRSGVWEAYGLLKAESDTSRRILVDAARDLMLLPNLGKLKANYTIPEIYLPHELVAHHFETRLTGKQGLLSSRLQHMLRLCPVARVCYVVIHDFEYFQAQGVDASFQTFGRNDLEWYRQEHEQVEPQTSSMTYPIGDRIYYELKIEDVPLTSDLRLILGEMRSVEEWFRTDYPGPLQRPRLAFRLMTWRLA
ncbi:hypothetical protein CDV36_008954 [Fusarium kuroshium]|uniref:2EXR domain-containing protein n=1 Tax=Fusarium kuroshium TaxID=2010991 RepID=A0A3M2S1P3_9HYPO|nr:hypothetical protein CDV36_008954 [Fusarium kuroshium]